MKKFYVASDHAGRKVKLKALKLLEELKIPFEDLSPVNTDTDDYPDFAKQVTKKVSGNSYGLLVCGTGIGMSIAANKVKGVRAALVMDAKDAKLAREHNNSNILVLSGWKNYKDLKKILKDFHTTNFLKGRHSRRVNKIKDLE